jgi:hypothetical protein
LVEKSYIKKIILVCSIVLLLIPLAYVSFVIYESIVENSNLEKSRSFHIRTSYNFNQSYLHGREAPADIEIDLKVDYPHGTLIVDDQVEITGIATLNSLNAQNVRSLAIGFQNAQAWPQNQSNKGITKEVNLFLERIQNEQIITGKTTVMWPLEGTYFLKIVLNFKDGTIQDTAWNKDYAITVYPKSQSAQNITNKAILLLTIPAFILAFIKLFGIIKNFFTAMLIDKNNEVDNKHKNTKSNTNTNDNNSNNTCKGFNGENKNKTSCPDYQQRPKE